MKHIVSVVLGVFVLGFLIACGSGSSDSGGAVNVSGNWNGTYREEVNGGNVFCQYNADGSLTQVGTSISGTFTLTLTVASQGANCPGGEWQISNGVLNGNTITITDDGVTATFTVAGGNARIFGEFDFNEDGVSGTASVNINRG